MRDRTNIFQNLNNEARRIFDVVQKNGPVSKNDISLVTGLKLTTLIRLMQPLEDLGLVVESKIGESTGGRKPVLYDADTNRFCIIGIDISRIYTQIVVTDLKMNILARYRFEMDNSRSPEMAVKHIENAVKNLLNEEKIKDRKVIGAGVGAVGPLDRDKGIIKEAVNFEAAGWVNVPLQSMLEASLGCPVAMDNGANTAVLAETCFGAGKGLKNVVYFNCGIGIRTGAISSGAIIRAINDSEDLFGHMVIDIDGEECSCGNYGCIECYSSIPAITRKFVSEVKKGRTTSIAKPLAQVGYIDICNAAEKNDLLAREVMQGAAAILGTGMANFINLLNPGLVILSGPLVKHSNLFYAVSTDIASKKFYFKKENNILFSRGGYFEENAISVGSAALVIESLLKSPGLN